MGETMRPFFPRSGFEYLATLTGRPLQASRWFDLRIRQLQDTNWTLRGMRRMLVEESTAAPWDNNLTDYGDAT